jgi:hypothetical protein
LQRSIAFSPEPFNAFREWIVSVEDLEAVEAAQPNRGQPNATTPDTALIVSDDRAQSDDR